MIELDRVPRSSCSRLVISALAAARVVWSVKCSVVMNRRMLCRSPSSASCSACPRQTSRFRAWSRELVRLLDPLVASDALERALLARLELRGYLRGLIAERRAHPAGDLLSAL